MSESRLEIIKDIVTVIVKKIIHWGLIYYGIGFVFLGAACIGSEGFFYRYKPYVVTSFFAFIYFVVWFTKESHESHLNLLYGDEKKYKKFMQKVEKAIGRNPSKNDFM